MRIVVMLAGIGLVLMAVADLVWTTLAPSGAGGPVTSRLAHWLWELIRTDRDVPRRHQLMRLGGLGVVGTSILTWVGMIWLGWACIFFGAADAVVSGTTGTPAGWWDRVYFAGTTISTLGLGDLVPRGTGWHLATAFASLNGLLFATLAITYLVPVIGAVTSRRQVALQIAALGDDPYAIAARADGTGAIAHLDGQLRHLNAALHRLAQHHLTYPALHYFHDISRETAGPVQIAVLDEALTLLAFGVDSSEPGTNVDVTRAAIHTVLATLTAAYIAPADEPPPPPDLARLRGLGIPTVGEEEFLPHVDELADRRRALLAFVEDDGWTWEDVYPSPAREEEEEAPRGSVTETPADGGS